MTTAAESHDAQLAAIKARHEALAAKFNDPSVTRVDDGLDFAMIVQVGLTVAYVDEIGRFWKVTVGGEPRRVIAEMVFDPKATSAVWEAEPAAAEDEVYVREGKAESHPVVAGLRADYSAQATDAFEAAAKIAENPGFIQARDTEWDEGVNFAKRFIADAIRKHARGDPSDTQAAQGFPAKG